MKNITKTLILGIALGTVTFSSQFMHAQGPSRNTLKSNVRMKKILVNPRKERHILRGIGKLGKAAIWAGTGTALFFFEDLQCWLVGKIANITPNTNVKVDPYYDSRTGEQIYPDCLTSTEIDCKPLLNTESKIAGAGCGMVALWNLVEAIQDFRKR